MASMMNDGEILLGSHLSLKADDFYLGTARQAIALGETAFMFYTGAPQNTRRLPLEKMKIPEGRAFLKEHGIDETKLVIHAPYVINLANAANGENYAFAKSFLKEEIRRCRAFGVSLLVLHPGSAIDGDVEKGIASLGAALDEVLSDEAEPFFVCLETMAGKGHEIGRSFEELHQILQKCAHPEHLGVCLDTCHLNDAGMDVNDVAGLLKHFDETIGLPFLKVIHLNDSKNPRGSRKDRHENIGYGTIGFPTLEAWVKEEKLQRIPKILETPAFNEKETWGREVAMLRKNTYDPSWRDQL